MFVLLSLGCMNSNGVTGFDYSHNGYWSTGYSHKGYNTKAECAALCLGETSCVAINTYGLSSAGSCYTYNNVASLIDTNKRTYSRTEAYVKC